MDSLTIQNDRSAHQRLWQAVIDNAIVDWMGGPVGDRREAEHFLFHDEDDFPLVCRSAGQDPEFIRESLWTIRALRVSQPNTHAA